MGGLRLSAGEVARSHAAGRGQLGLLRARPHRDRPQLVARVPARLGLGRGAGQGEPRARRPARPGTSRPATSRTASPTSTASSATSGATKARRATWTGAGTITAPSTPSAVIRRSRAGSTRSTTTSSTSGTATGASTAARSSRDGGSRRRHDAARPARAALRGGGHARRPEPLGEGGGDGGGAALGLVPDREHRLRRRPRPGGAPPDGTRWAGSGRVHDAAGGRVSSLDVRGARAAVGADAEGARGGRPGRRADRPRRAPSCIGTSPPSWWRGPRPDEVTLADGRKARVARVDAGGIFGRAVVGQAVERARRAEGERRRIRVTSNTACPGRRTSRSPIWPRPRSWSRPRPSSSTARTGRTRARCPATTCAAWARSIRAGTPTPTR